jgi:hypothetical protein
MHEPDSFTRVVLNVDVDQRFDNIRPDVVNLALVNDKLHPIEVTARRVKNGFD